MHRVARIERSEIREPKTVARMHCVARIERSETREQKQWPRRAHGSLSKKSSPRRYLLPYRHPSRQAEPLACRCNQPFSCRYRSRKIPPSVWHRRHRRAPRSLACHHDFAGRRLRLSGPDTPDQSGIHSPVTNKWCPGSPHGQRRGIAVAATILGAYDPKRRGFAAARGLHSLQPREAQSCFRADRMAAFIPSPIHRARMDSCRLGKLSYRHARTIW